jgi:hypothetical protein
VYAELEGTMTDRQVQKVVEMYRSIAATNRDDATTAFLLTNRKSRLTTHLNAS